MRLREFFYEENSKEENIAEEEKEDKFKVAHSVSFENFYLVMFYGNLRKPNELILVGKKNIFFAL